MILLIDLQQRSPESFGRYKILVQSRDAKTQREAIASWGGLEFTLINEDLAANEYISHWWDHRIIEEFYSETLKKMTGFK